MNAADLLAEAMRLSGLGRRRDAIAAYQAFLKRNPAHADSWYDLAILLRAEGRPDDALNAYEEALKRNISDPEEVHLNRGVIFADDLRRDDDAAREFEAAIRLNPDFAPAVLNLANLKEECGEREAAASLYRQIAPASGAATAPHHEMRLEALARLAHLEPPSSAEDPSLDRLADAASRAGAASPITRANLWYALGRALDALGQYDRAFEAFLAANREVRRGGPAYDPARVTRDVDALITAFATRAGGTRQDAAPRPVFICGMFRSGSTLVEQALTAHPRVTPGGELNLLNRIADIDLAPYPQSIPALDDRRAAALARRYTDDLRRIFPECATPGAIVTDKRPDNFLRIGLIKRLFPDARIVHTVRDPVDTCLSTFFQHLDQRLAGYASDLADCGRYYGEYRRMMAHWKKLYADDIIDFDYDRFVANPRPELERLLSFLGLEWSESCLAFHELKNSVKTASYWQVRRPLYRESSGRGRRYAPFLAPLTGALRDAGVVID